jgi:tetratricopeptide (TPR) repeat protein
MRAIPPRDRPDHLEGPFLLGSRTEESLKKAIGYYEQAIARDPNFALAHVGLSDVHNTMIDYAPVRAQDVIPKAKAAAERALAIDDALAEAHTSLASALEMGMGLGGSGARIQACYRTRPNYALAHKWYGLMLMGFGKLDDAHSPLSARPGTGPLISPA